MWWNVVSRWRNAASSGNSYGTDENEKLADVVLKIIVIL
jgi:hypothetical protein